MMISRYRLTKSEYQALTGRVRNSSSGIPLVPTTHGITRGKFLPNAASSESARARQMLNKKLLFQVFSKLHLTQSITRSRESQQVGYTGGGVSPRFA